MDKIFEINYKRLALLLLPTFLRQDVLAAFLRAMITPNETLYNLFINNRKSNIYQLRMNGQVCYLRKVLNDAFPSANNAIQIDNSKSVGGWQYAWDRDYDPYLRYLLITDEGTVFRDKSAILQSVNGFIVSVPRALYNVNNDAKLRSLLNAYKLLGKSYTIIYE
jgi:hypothetical protein